MVGHKVTIDPARVNKAARQDSINFCCADGTLGLRVALLFYFFKTREVRLDESSLLQTDLEGKPNVNTDLLCF